MATSALSSSCALDTSTRSGPAATTTVSFTVSALARRDMELTASFAAAGVPHTATAVALLFNAVVEAIADAADVHDDEVDVLVRHPLSCEGDGRSSGAARMTPLATVLCEMAGAHRHYLQQQQRSGDVGTLLPLLLEFIRGADLFAVFRLRGGKGKAGFQKTLKRKGREFTRAARAGQIQTAGTQQNTNTNHGGGATPATRTLARRRFGGDATTNATLTGQRFVRRDGSGRSAAMGGGRSRQQQQRGSSGGVPDGGDGQPLPSDHPIEVLRREQARGQAQLKAWSVRADTAIGNGLQMLMAMKQQTQQQQQ